MPTVPVTRLEDTQRLAQAIASLLRPQDCLTLTGTLGAGKTTLMQHLAKALEVQEEVTSPTFTIVQSYPISLQHQATTLYHMDAYRLEEASELEEIGLPEMLETGILAIEWPEICADWLPKQRIAITLEVENNTRKASITAASREDALVKALTRYELLPS